MADKIIKINRGSLIPNNKEQDSEDLNNNSKNIDAYKEKEQAELKQETKNKEKKVKENYSTKIKKYLGSEYKYFYQNININALLFNGYYYLYRKMYLLGITTIFVSLILIRISIILYLVYSIILLLTTNKLYIMTIKQKIKKNKLPSVKVSKIIPVIAIILTIILYLIISYLILLTEVDSSLLNI